METPIVFTDRRYGQSKMSSRIVVESMLLVTRWGAARPRHRAGREAAERGLSRRTGRDQRSRSPIAE